MEHSSNNKLILNETNNLNDAKRVIVTVYLGDSPTPLEDILTDDDSCFNNQIIIGAIYINTKTKWDALDNMVKKLFKQYLNRLDEKAVESGGLGLSLESIHFYYVGDMLREPFGGSADKTLPDLLPYGYLVANHTNIVVKLKDASQNSIDSLCYDTLVPKCVMQRYVSLILDYRNLLFCGPVGTSKTYIARKIAEYLAKRFNKDLDTSIAYFNVENKSVKELKQYLNNIIEQSNLATCDQVPYVLILDNLHYVSNISDAFLEFFSSKNVNKKW